MKISLTRRQFFRLGPSDLLKSIVDSSKRDDSDSEPVTRPPGASKDDADFLEKCSRCGDCAEACPHGVISLLGPVSGLTEGTPVIDTNSVPCQWCSSMDCVNACNTGALCFTSGGRVDPIGKATLDLNLCLNSHGIICDDCANSCPKGINAIKFKNRKPEINHDDCVGCGLCVYYCSASPVAIRVHVSDTNSTPVSKSVVVRAEPEKEKT
jgi:ferredoxin-type protein NapG